MRCRSNGGAGTMSGKPAGPSLNTPSSSAFIPLAAGPALPCWQTNFGECPPRRSSDLTYIRALIGGLSQGLRTAQQFDWDGVLSLCEFAPRKAPEISGDRDASPPDADPGW